MNHNEIYCSENSIKGYGIKIIKCRKTHKCASCSKTIESGVYAVRESGFMDGKPVHSYTCLDCLDAWIDEIKQSQI